MKGTKRPVAEYLGFPYNGKSLVSTGSTIVGLMREPTLDILPWMSGVGEIRDTKRCQTAARL